MQPRSFAWVWNGARLLLLLLVPVGYLITADFFAPQSLNYLMLSLCVFIAMLALLLGLPRVRMSNLVIVILLLILAIGYFFKFYYMAYLLGTDSPQALMTAMFGLSAKWVDITKAYRAYETVAITFIVFSFVSVLLMSLLRRQKAYQFIMPQRTVNRACFRLTLGAVTLALITGGPRYMLRVGGGTLPFHLEGIINILNHIFVPSLLGLVLVLVMECRNTRLVQRTMLIFTGWGTLMFMLFTSKIYLLHPFFWYGLGSVVTGFRNRQMENFFIFSVLGFILLLPFIGIFRMAKMAVLMTSASPNFIEEYSHLFLLLISDIDGIGAIVWLGLSSLIYRMVGFSELISMQVLFDANPHGFISYLISGQSAEALLTYSMGFDKGTTGVASSLLGQAYFATGSVLGTAFWVAGWTAVFYIVFLKLISRNGPLYCAIWVVTMVNFIFWSIDSFSFTKVQFLLLSWAGMAVAYYYAMRSAPLINGNAIVKGK